MKATLVLSDGTTFQGTSFGYEKSVAGELVFNTATSGYPELLTDASSAGQLLAITYPVIGNYGVPPIESDVNGLSAFMESEHIHAAALIVSDYSEQFSHWNGKESLSSWLKREQVPGIQGIDTRALAHHLREHGTMSARILMENQDCPAIDHDAICWQERVSCSQVMRYNEGEGKKVVLLDLGVKHSYIKYLINHGVEIVRVPWNYDFNTLDFDALFLSNGGGNPMLCTEAIEHIRTFLQTSSKPCLGIEMGHLLLAAAAGAQVDKLKFGHHGHNQPVREVGETRCFITSQNHSYEVNALTLPQDWKETFVNLNDNSCEGMRHESKPWASFQFAPEVCCAELDTDFVLDNFIEQLS